MKQLGHNGGVDVLAPRDVIRHGRGRGSGRAVLRSVLTPSRTFQKIKTVSYRINGKRHEKRLLSRFRAVLHGTALGTEGGGHPRGLPCA